MTKSEINTLKEVLYACKLHLDVLENCICENKDDQFGSLEDIYIGLQISIDKLRQIIEDNNTWV